MEKRLFNTLLMKKHDFWPFQWFLNSQIRGLKKLLSMSILKDWQLTLIWQNKTPWGNSYRKKGFFWHSSDEKTWFLTFPVVFNGQKWGILKASLYVNFEGLTTDSYSDKTRPPGGVHIEKRVFWHSSDEKNMISDLSSSFLRVKNGGLKVSLCPFWRFDNWLLFWQNKTPLPPLGGLHIEKKVFFNTLLMKKHDFWPFQ